MMGKIKAFFRCLIEICLQLRRNFKLYYFKALWKQRNKHNKTVAGNVFPKDRVTVGKGTYGMLNVHWFGTNEGELHIGNFCSIAENVHFFLAGEHNYKRFSSYPFIAQYGNRQVDEICKGPIVVDDDVWIGFNSTILSGVKIGKGAVIAAGSIVTKNVPPYSIWISNKVHSYRFDQSTIDKLSKVSFDKIDPIKIRNSSCLLERVTDDNIGLIIKEIEKCYTGDL